MKQGGWAGGGGGKKGDEDAKSGRGYTIGLTGGGQISAWALRFSRGTGSGP